MGEVDVPYGDIVEYIKKGVNAHVGSYEVKNGFSPFLAINHKDHGKTQMSGFQMTYTIENSLYY